MKYTGKVPVLTPKELRQLKLLRERGFAQYTAEQIRRLRNRWRRVARGEFGLRYDVRMPLDVVQRHAEDVVKWANVALELRRYVQGTLL